MRDDLVSYWGGGGLGERSKLLKVQGGSPRVLSAFKPPPPEQSQEGGATVTERDGRRNQTRG